MKSPKILLIGIGGVYNYGCEAIVRGTEAILHSRWPDLKIVYASPRPEDDRKRLSGCQVQIIPRIFNRYSATNLLRKLLSIAGIAWRPNLDSLSLLDGIDAVLSIGGDIYTLHANRGFHAALPKFGTAAERSGTPYILWGASVGPFTANPKAEDFFRKHLNNITKIVAREQDTVAYLASIGVADNVVTLPDPAFSVAPEITKSEESKKRQLTIGLNLSPLSARYTGLSVDDAVRSQAQTIERIINEFHAQIILMPHVVCDFNPRDDDLLYLQTVQQAIAKTLRANVRLIESDPGFIGIKRVMVDCDLVIAARMHCAINALTAHVPTLLLSYSQKAKGMAEFVYGDQSMVMDLKDFNERTIVESIKGIIDRKVVIGKKLQTRIKTIQDIQINSDLTFLQSSISRKH